MSTIEVPIGKPQPPTYGQCKCCLKNTYLRNMWEAHKNNGEIEVYGQMLVDCFSIDWTIVTMEDDNMCQVCITKLRVSNIFKKQVLESQAATLEAAQVEEQPENDVVLETAILQNDETSCTEEVTIPLTKDLITVPMKKVCSITSLREEILTPPKDFAKEKSSDEENENSLKGISECLKYEKSESDTEIDATELVEFLEEDCLDDFDDDDEASEPNKKKRKRTRNLQTRNQRTMYKNYPEDEIEKAVEAVKSGQMSKREAATVFNVPRESIAATRMAEKTSEDVVTKHLVRAIRALLTHTNATPFKVTRQSNGFICFYCGNDGPVFLQPDELRHHTHSEHPDKIRRTEFAVRPRCLNQTIRLDVYNLKCECSEKILWEDLLDHLEEKHQVTDTDEARKIIVPYELQTETDVMSCVFQACDYSGCFSKLDTHVHEHFPNFICGECGKPFANIGRLKRHEKLHEIGEYPCEECDLVFTSKKKRKFHQDTVHAKKLLHKCSVCPLRFESDKSRSEHLREDHKDLVESKGRYCNLCGNSYWPRDFTWHMKFEHDKHTCKVCGWRFDRVARLKLHRCQPDVESKKFKCGICSRLFFTKQSVLKHMSKAHSQD